jgi:hypothetical protein
MAVKPVEPNQRGTGLSSHLKATAIGGTWHCCHLTPVATCL